MARGVNRTISIGNLCADPETRYLPSGAAVTNIRIAMNNSYKDKNTGQQVDKAEYMAVVFFSKLAEVVAQYLRKGSKVYIEGQLRTRQWEKDGQKHYTTEIVASELQMLDSKHEHGGSGNTAQTPASQSGTDNAAGFDEFDDDSIPF